MIPSPENWSSVPSNWLATEAAGVATAYCSQMGKAMYLDGMEQHGSASVGRYRCI
jgi:hypothetical protein